MTTASRQKAGTAPVRSRSGERRRTTSTVRFSSEDWPARNRLAHLRETVGRKFTNTEIIPLDEDFRIDISLQMFPGLSVMRGSNTPHRFAGPFEAVRANDDMLMVWTDGPGEMRWAQGGVDLALRDSIATLMSSDDRRVGENRHHASYTTVRVERARLDQLVANPQASLMQPIAADAEPLRLLKHYLEGLRTPDSEALAEAISTHIYDLVALTLGTTRDAADLARGRGLRLARLDAARKLARANLWNQRYTVNEAALTLGLSPRTLQTLFQDEGTTFSAFLMTQRLAAVHAQLRRGHKANLPISMIAFEAGFGDLSHFNHAFRRAYDETPTDVRARAEQAHRRA